MSKPPVIEGYDENLTVDCERVLVTLLNGMGPWKESVYLVGGLAPRYLVRARPPEVPAHAGTGDVDIVVDFTVLAYTEAYNTLEQNLTHLGFQRAINKDGARVNWQWEILTRENTTVVLEFLSCNPDLPGSKVQELPTKGNLSAINIPYASMVFDLHDQREIKAELLTGEGWAVETIAYANIVSFTCLKAFAMNHRAARKDAHDLVYCLENADNGLSPVVSQFRDAAKGPHAEAVSEAIKVIKRKFCSEPDLEGFLKDGPTRVSLFEHGESDTPELRELRVLRQREVSDLLERFVLEIENVD